MKVVEGHTLKFLIEKRGDGVTRYHLLQILHRVSMAVAYLHARGLVHRDIKPQNIMLGKFNEVTLMDFGIAKNLRRGISTVHADGGQETMHRVIQGTPAYMAPEQALGEGGSMPATDQFALGAVLYHILTGRPPYDGPEHLIFPRVATASFEPVRSVDPSVPVDIEQICLRAMKRDPEERYTSVEGFAEALAHFLDTEQKAAANQKEAQRALAEADERIRRYEALMREREAADADYHRLGEGFNVPGEGVPFLRAKKRAYQINSRCEQEFSNIVQSLVRCSDLSPLDPTPKQRIADLALPKMLEMEQKGEDSKMRLYQSLVQSYHGGKYARELRGDCSVAIATVPEGAHVYLAELREAGVKILSGEERYLGTTPISRMSLPMGDYLASLRHPDRPEVQYHFLLMRNEELTLEVPLISAGQLLPGFIYIPAGRFLALGSFSDPRGLPIYARTLPGFCIGRNPVTVREYLEFLNDSEAHPSIEAALEKSPRQANGSRLFQPGPRLPLLPHPCRTHPGVPTERL